MLLKIDGRMALQPAGGPETCGRCAGLGPTCCHNLPGEAEFLAPVSEAEQAALATELPWLEPGEVVVPAENTPEFIYHLRRLFPDREEAVRRAYPLGGRHHRLAVRPDGRCPLLGPRGCLTQPETRPLYCRIFPFWLTGGQLQLFSDPGCLAQRECRLVKDLLEALDTDPEKILSLHAQIVRAWGLARSGAR